MLSDSDILNIITQELEQSLTFSPEAGLGQAAPSIEDPLRYYLGLPLGNEVEGRSQVISTDVADSIEWIMPQLMKQLTSTNEVVTFDPISPDDELQCALETQYVYDVLMKQNEGFILLHECIKDALMQRNGVIKTYYEEESKINVETYTGILPEQMTVLVSQPDVEVRSLTQNSDQTIDVEITREKSCGKIRVECVPLENFRVNADHNSICLDHARFVAHEITTTVSDLRQEGLDEELIRQISPSMRNPSAYRFELQGESTLPHRSTADESMVEVTKYECYLHIDINDDGIAEYTKVTVAGEGSPNVILSIEPLEESPWVAATTILMSHKFQGLSIYDRLKSIQDQKTSLLRNILDNIYLINNQQKKVIENQVNMDDVLTSRVGGNIRVKNMGALEPISVQPLDPMSVELLRYLDEIRAGRTGVSAEGGTAPQNIGDRVGSEGVAQLMSAKEELVGLIIRLFAETGMKPLCLKIRCLINKHFDAIYPYKFRGQWYQIQPSVWPERTMCTVRVGTGSGDKAYKLAALKELQSLQATVAQSPAAYMVNDIKVFRCIDDYCKAFGLTGAANYFVDPSSQEGQQAKIQHQQSQQEAQQKQEMVTLEQIKMEQSIAQAQLIAAQAQSDNVTLKGQIEALKHQREIEKQQQNLEMSELKAQLEHANSLAAEAQKNQDLIFKYTELDAKSLIEFAKLNQQKDLVMIEKDKQDSAQEETQDGL